MLSFRRKRTSKDLYSSGLQGPPHGRRSDRGSLGPPSPVVAVEAGGQERMAGFAHPGQEGRPSLSVAPGQGGGGECVGAADIPPFRLVPPDQPQARVRLQRDRPPACTGGI